MEIICGGQLNKDIATAVTIGNFDGVHMGHQKLLKALTKQAKAQGIKSLLYTFREHPVTLMKGDVSIISEEAEKIRMMEDAGVDILYLVDFMQVKDLEPETFVQDILLKECNMQTAVIGENNRFGKGSRGDAALLCRLGEIYGFKTHVVSSYVTDGVVCSSSEIRRRVQKGEMPGAAVLLGRPFSLTGTVVSGKHLGRTYGFPTANINPSPKQLLPKQGVYATNAVVDGVRYPAITNVGKNSFEKNEHVWVETHLLDFEKDLYGKELKIEFLHYMRDIQKVSSTEELKAILIKDRENRRKDREEQT